MPGHHTVLNIYSDLTRIATLAKHQMCLVSARKIMKTVMLEMSDLASMLTAGGVRGVLCLAPGTPLHGEAAAGPAVLQRSCNARLASSQLTDHLEVFLKSPGL